MKYLIVICFFFCVSHLPSQNSGYYYMYDFEKFGKSKTTGYIDLLKELYLTIDFPNDLRKTETEGSAAFYIFSHGDKTIEIIPSEKPNLFHSHVLSKLDTLHCLELRTNEKFITEFIVKFDLPPFDSYTEEKNVIHIMQYKIPGIDHDRTCN